MVDLFNENFVRAEFQDSFGHIQLKSNYLNKSKLNAIKSYIFLVKYLA